MAVLTKKQKAHIYYVAHKKQYAEHTRKWRAKRLALNGVSYTTVYSRKWSAVPKNRETMRRAWREYDAKMRASVPGWKADIHRRYRIANPIRIKANELASYAIKKRLLKPKPCEVCGKKKPYRIEAHHDDHSKPYEVRWLCVPHHKMQKHLTKPHQASPTKILPMR